MIPAGARPPFEYLAVLFVVSASMLCFEVLLVRLFEFSHWHHFAGLAVSLALLGLGAAGTCLTVLGDRTARYGDGLILAGIVVQAAGMLAVLMLHSKIAIRPLFAVWDSGELFRLMLVDFAAFIPFFGAGLVIGQVFMRWTAASPSIYAANLLGSGAGSVAASALLSVMDVERVLALAALLPALALPVLGRKRGRAAAGGAILLCVAGFALLARPPAPAISDFKALSQVLDLPDARRLAAQTGLQGRLTVVRSDSLRSAPGLSLDWTEPLPAVDAVIVGSDRLVPVSRSFPADAAHMQASLVDLPFQLRPRGRTLVLGASAWQSPVAATGRELVWVEPDERLLSLAGERGLAGPGVALVADGAYRYLAATVLDFELVVVDAAFAGGDAASEDYLMTVEGLSAALSRLTPRGLLVVPLKLSVPPRQAPRAMATLRDALERLGIARPGRHVAAVRGLQETVLLASPRPLSAADLLEIRGFAASRRFDLVWLADLRESETNRYHRLDAPMFFQAARAVFEAGDMPQAARWFENTPAVLDRPYFWRSLVWSRIPDFLRSMGRQQALSYLDWTLILTAVSAAFAAVLAFMLIVAPLGRLPAMTGVHSRVTVAGYFAALGLGYMLLELAVFQRAILFLGEPVTAAALVFAVFLIGSGFGSAMAPSRTGLRDVAQIFGAIAGGLVISATVLWLLADRVLQLPWSGRMAAMAAALAPLTWAMGRAFPWALRQLSGHGRWVPWAWGINGFASVVAASLSTLISVQLGQSATLAASVLCYVTAACIAWRWIKCAGRTS